ncbi:TIM44-like domain-containing protein [Reyranella aquatilis]|uniref:TIM44-like domain-containing protein n=1 Tax=Reyranella aquatilis TaxID=2035356 RepID=A0ABS8L009_9HYPH|nr:TIM44-like domain-containing protein [Reyranella aquatilis]MCC8431680.1 TIM44-like domain-containing protein [Reyranella aquatilis]
MTRFRWLAILAALIIAVPSLAPSPADARAGGGSGSGSRGSKSGDAPAPTQTAPTSKPVERSTTPQQKSPSASPANTAAAGAKPGFMQRNPFLSGLLGGMLGAGLIGMLFGGGFGAGLAGLAGMLGFLLQIALIGGIVYFAVRWWKSRNGTPAAAFAGAGAGGGTPPSPNSAQPEATPMARSGLQSMLGGAGAGAASGFATPQLAILEADYNAFEALLKDVQAAYSAGDLARLRSLVTPEMLGYFSQELSANASRGVENKVTDVKLEQGDLSEAWSEGPIDYATVAMRFSMIDVMRNVADGRVVEGNEQVRSEATEVWTFLRSQGGNWILSAIQQT